MNLRILFIFFFLTFICCANRVAAEPPDTVRVGIYITSIHDIDFRQKEYVVNLWLWLDYKDSEFDFIKNLELPQAKTVQKSYSTLDTIDGKIHLLMKLQCVMKDSWKIGNFPFDRQKLRLTIENSEFDSRFLVFAADTIGKHFDPRFTLSGWEIDSFKISTGTKDYETAFGDTSLQVPHSEYSTFRVVLGIKRDAWGLFWKMFLGMYVSVLIAYVCFYIPANSIESRFGLSVGSLFAAIGNKYIIDSTLPESSSYTLVDTLHGLTLIFIFIVIASTVYALILRKENKVGQLNRLDMIIAQTLLIAYVGLNFYFIYDAL